MRIYKSGPRMEKSRPWYEPYHDKIIDKIIRLIRYRLFSYSWWRTHRWFFGLRCAYNRARYGYCVSDVWSIDYYVDAWMPSAIRDLANMNHGCPMVIFDENGEMFSNDYWDEYDNSTYSEEYLDSIDKFMFDLWYNTLERIAQGFEAHYDLCNEPYLWREKEREKEVEETAQAGLQLFVRNYSALWD